MLLQIMEEGHLSDARGRKVDFRNAMIIMTSNVGADVIRRQTRLGFALKTDTDTEEKLADQDMRRKLNIALKRTFRPEFINRVDSTIIFRALNRDDLHSIVSLELEKVSTRLEEYDIVLDASPDAIQLLSELGYDPEFGARPLRRVIQNRIEDNLSDGLLSGRFENGDIVMIDVTEDEDSGKDLDMKTTGKVQRPEAETETETEIESDSSSDADTDENEPEEVAAV